MKSNINLSQATQVLEIFRHRLTDSMSIRKMAKLLKLSYEPAYRRAKQMEKIGYLAKAYEKYKVNLKNNSVIKIFEFLADREREKTLKKYKKLQTLSQITELAEKNGSISYIVLFGSYAKGNPTMHSDIDILIVLEKENFNQTRKQIETTLSFIRETNITNKYKFSPIFAQTTDIKEMIDDKKPIMLDILKEGIILFGERKFYRDIAEYLKEW